MAIDRKYGRVTVEHGDVYHGGPGIPLNHSNDEPVFIIRAQDEFSTKAIGQYGAIALTEGAPAEFLNAVAAVQDSFINWQRAHPERVKKPD